MTGFDFGDDLAELTLSKLLPYAPPFPSRRAHFHHCNSSFRIGRLYSSFKRDAGLTPNAPVKDAGVRSTEASLPLAG